MSIQTPGQIPQPDSGKRVEAEDPSAAEPAAEPDAEPDAQTEADPSAAPPPMNASGPIGALSSSSTGAPVSEAVVTGQSYNGSSVVGPAALPVATSPGILGRVPGDLRAFLGIGLAGMVMGVVVGALWRWISPAIQGVITQGSAYYAAPEGKTFIAQDGWFAVLSLCAGTLLAVSAFVRCRATGSLGAILGLGAGGVGGGYLAAWFGTYIGPGHGSIQRTVQGVAENATFDLPMQLRSTGVIWLWPAVAAGLYFFLMLLFGPDDPPRAAQIEAAPMQFWPEAYGARPGAADEAPAQNQTPTATDGDQERPAPSEGSDGPDSAS